MMICEEILTSLPKLTDTERQKVKLVLDNLFSSEPKVRSSSAPITITYSAFKKSFSRAGLEITIPQGILFKKKKDREAALWLVNWTKTKFQVSKKQETLTVTTFLFGCLISYLRDIDVPVAVGIVMNNIRNMP